MKMLFVCRANVGRSQMAEAFFNYFSKKNMATSAGVNPGSWKGHSLRETAFVSTCMNEEGIDVSEKKSKRLAKKMFDDADKIVVMVEKETVPEYLQNSSKVVYWNVEDPARGDLVFHRQIRDDIKKKVLKLVDDIEN